MLENNQEEETHNRRSQASLKYQATKIKLEVCRKERTSPNLKKKRKYPRAAWRVGGGGCSARFEWTPNLPADELATAQNRTSNCLISPQAEALTAAGCCPCLHQGAAVRRAASPRISLPRPLLSSAYLAATRALGI